RDENENDLGNWISAGGEMGGFRGGNQSGRGGFGGGYRGKDEETFSQGENKEKDENESNRPKVTYIPPTLPEDEDSIFSHYETGINFDKYDDIMVDVSGTNPPQAVMTFEEAALCESLRKNISKSGYVKPTPVQKHGIPIVSAGRDLMACAQTGSGKTAAFLLPILQQLMADGVAASRFSELQEPEAVIVAPTRELINQIYLEARKFSFGTCVRSVVVYGGVSTAHQMREISKGCNVLCGTPGRLLDMIGRGKVGLSKLRYLVLDEADRMLDMGFEPDMRRLVGSPGMPSKENRQTLMFSATYPEDIQRMASDFLKTDYLFLAVGVVGGACSDVEQTFIQVTKFSKREQLLDLLKTTGTERTMVFVETKRLADFIAAYLCQEKVPTTSIHGDREQREREQALADFRSGRCPVLVATSVAARGLDIPDVQHVVNFDLPNNIDEYVHRIGRTGRCGNTGRAVSFYDPDVDGQLARSLVTVLSKAQQEVPSWLEESAFSGHSSTGFISTRKNFASTDSRKAVTSGRLTGGVKVQPARRRTPLNPNPGPAACPQPAYSLYSTDSEDQVTSLHKGLDRCAALLSGILQAESTDASPSLPRAVKSGAAKSKPSSASLGKKSIRKLATKTDQKSPSVQRGPGRTTPRTTPHSPVPAAHSGVKLHPPQKQPQNLLQSHLPPSHSQTPAHPPPRSHNSTPRLYLTPLSGRLPPPLTDCQAASEAECDRDEEESVPVRDIDPQSTAANTHRHTQSHIQACVMKTSNMQREPGQADDVPQDTHSMEDCSAEAEVRVRTVQYLLGELKALIAGQGSVAERLLSHLEQTVSSPLMNVGSSNIQTEPDLASLHNQNAQLRRRVKILNQQLKEKEKAERQQNVGTLCHSEVSTLQEELTVAQSRLQELQEDLTELRKALQDTQSQLRDREAENALIKTDLEATRRRLLDSEREKGELASIAQQRLEEIGNLNRVLQSRKSSNYPAVVDSSVSAKPPADRITQFLMSLGQLEPAHTELVRVAAEREGNTPEQRKPASVQLSNASSHPDVRAQTGDGPAETSPRRQNPHLDQSRPLDEVQPCGRRREEEERSKLSVSTLSQSDVESVWSDWSARSVSVCSTRDEAAFRDGLAALDASIANLQKTIHLDLGR
ncbi:hypothetical protein L3Q82_009727, partial [Scortum barcoo]